MAENVAFQQRFYFSTCRCVLILWWADTVECVLPRAFVLSHLCVCVYVIHLSEQNARGHSRETKGEDTALSERKSEFNFRQSYSVERNRRSLSLSSLPYSFFHSCWQSLIALDKLMKSNNEEATGSSSCSLLLPECTSVCAYLPVPMSSCLLASGVPVNTMMRR